MEGSSSSSLTSTQNNTVAAKEEEKGKKKSGRLPLRMFLNMEDAFLLPACPNASNPFHKCAPYCFNKASQATKEIFGGYPLGTETELSNQKKTDSLHHNRSNPSHEYEICSESSIESNQAGKGEHEETMKPMDRHVNPECINASNPFHICAEYCRQKVHDKDAVHGRPLDFKSTEKKMTLSNAMKLLKFKGGNSSNQQSSAVACCGPRIMEKDHSEGETWKKVGKMERWNVHPDCLYASNPYHVCVDECFDLIRDKYQHSQEHGTKGSTLAKKLKEATCIDTSITSYDCTSCFGKSSKSNDPQEGVEKRKDDAKIQNESSQSKISDADYPKFGSYYSSRENGGDGEDDGENTSESEDDGDSTMLSEKVSGSMDLSNSSDKSTVHCSQGPSKNEHDQEDPNLGDHSHLADKASHLKHSDNEQETL